MTADEDIAKQHTERMLRGWKDISTYLEVSVLRAQERAKRTRDPLPVFYDHRGPFAYVSALREWVARSRLAYQAHLELARRSNDARSISRSVSIEKRRMRRDAP